MPVAGRQATLLDELVDLFLAEGFLHLTLGDMAARLHCSKTTLYAFGDSKEQLVAAAVHHFSRTTAESVERRARLRADPTEQLISYLEGLAEALRPASAQFIADIAAHRPARDAYRRNTEAAVKRVCQLIDAGVEAGAFRPVSAAFVADVLAATMERIQTGQVLARTGMHDAEAYRELAALVLGGIRS